MKAMITGGKHFHFNTAVRSCLPKAAHLTGCMPKLKKAEHKKKKKKTSNASMWKHFEKQARSCLQRVLTTGQESLEATRTILFWHFQRLMSKYHDLKERRDPRQGCA